MKSKSLKFWFVVFFIGLAVVLFGVSAFFHSDYVPRTWAQAYEGEGSGADWETVVGGICLTIGIFIAWPKKKK